MTAPRSVRRGSSPAAPGLSVGSVRRRTRALLELQKPAEQVDRVWDLIVPSGSEDGVLIRMFSPHGAEVGSEIIVLLHGGGWVAGDLTSHDRVARRVANRTGAVVALVDYRRAPERPYPAALDDAVAVTEWMTRCGAGAGVDPEQVVIMGDSAGGNLAASTCLRMVHAGSPLPLAQVLLYPILLPPGEDGSSVSEGQYPDRATLRWYWEQYAGAATANAYAAPLLADSLVGVPPAIVYLGERDPVRVDGERYVERLRDAAVPTLTRTYAAPHAFVMMDAVEPSADAVLGDLPRDLDVILGRRAGRSV